MFKVFSVGTRIKIIEFLKSGKARGAKSIAEHLGITPAAVSQHLKVLRQAGLVERTRSGFYVPYSINADMMEKCRTLLNEVCQCGCRGTCRFGVRKNANLVFLKEYKKELKRELERVSEKIKKLEKN